MGFRVEVSEEANSDLVDILDWLVAHYAGEAGLEWFEGLEQAIASLDDYANAMPRSSGKFESSR